MSNSLLLEHLKKIGLERKTSSAPPYAGELFASEAWSLTQNETAYVVDVRTKAEWQFSGIVDLTQVKAKLLCVEWVSYPDFNANPSFVEQVKREIIDKHAIILFLCKTGGRSQMAANKLAEAGYENCFNVTHGFEGDHNEQMQRGRINGWKAEGLPWKQQ